MLKLMELSMAADLTFTYQYGGLMTADYKVWVNSEGVYEVCDASCELIAYTHSVDEVVEILRR